MDKKFIKVNDPKLADELVSLGFFYVKEQVNGNDTYAFVATQDLIELLNKNYDGKIFVKENKLHF